MEAQTKKKILIFATNYLPFIGGAELAVKYITDHLGDEYDFDLVTSHLDEDMPLVEQIGKVQVFRVGNKASLATFIVPKAFFPIAGFFKGRELLRKNKYDLIFVLQASQAGGAVWLLRKFGIITQPVLINIQEGKPLDQQFFLTKLGRRLIIKNADFFTVISRYLQKSLVKQGIKKNRITLIPNGVEIANFTREFSYGELSQLSDTLKIKPDEKVIISASRFAHKNAIDTLIEAFALLVNHWQGGRYKLILAGDGPLKEKLIQLTKDLEISEKVIFAGTVSHADLPKYFRISDIFIRPSRSEGLGSSFLEAMAGGLPVIATAVGGIPDFLQDKETGLFCEVDNPQSIADKVKMLLENRELYNKIITNAFKMVKESYSWEKIGDDYRQLIREITG